MPDIPDLLGAWRDAAAQLERMAASLADQAGHGARDVLGPLQRQSEVIEQLVRRQVELERQLVQQALAPARATAEALEKAPDGMRAQAAAFRAVARSFDQAAELLEVQAATLQQTVAMLTAPVDIARRTIVRGSNRSSG
jgi:hypothetical protein